MNKIILFLLGEKGYHVAQAASNPKLANVIECIIVDRDPNIEDDFSISIIQLCNKLGVNFFLRQDFKYKSEYNNNIAIAAGWRRLINDEYHKLIVLHDSLLPKYRGFNPLVTALLNKEDTIGVTAILANKKFDCGDIISYRSINISYPIKIANAIHMIAKLYFELATEIFSLIEEEKDLVCAVQNESDASYSIWRDEDDYRINWNNSANEIVHFIYCVGSPYKGASTLLEDSIIRIFDAELVSDVKLENRDVGKVLFVENEKPIIVCGSGLIKINLAKDQNNNNALPFKKFRTRLK